MTDAVAQRADTGLLALPVDRLQAELAKLPQYEPRTRHIFHGGLYCREVWREAGVLVVGVVHRKEHLYLILQGTVLITGGDGPAQRVSAPATLLSRPGTKRAVYAVTDALCMTVHRTDATTVEDAEAELVEADPTSLFDAGNKIKPHVLRHEPLEVLI